MFKIGKIVNVETFSQLKTKRKVSTNIWMPKGAFDCSCLIKVNSRQKRPRFDIYKWQFFVKSTKDQKKTYHFNRVVKNLCYA